MVQTMSLCVFLQEVDGIADATLAVSHADDVLGAPDPKLVKRWSAVGAAASLSPAHHRVLKHLSAMPSGGRKGSKGGLMLQQRLCRISSLTDTLIACN